MALALSHKFVTAKSDGTDATLIKPSNWNDTHALTGDAGNVLGIAPGGGTTVTQLPVSTAAVAALAATDPGASVGVPIGGMVMWFTNTLPGANWAWANGATITNANVSNAALFSLWTGGSYVSGNNVILPDLRANVPVGRGTMGGAADPVRGLPGNYNTLGAQIGEGTHGLVATEIPNLTVTGTVGITDSRDYQVPINNSATLGAQPMSPGGSLPNATTHSSVTVVGSITASFSGGGTSNTGSGGVGTGAVVPHNNVQPGLVCNYIVRIA